MSDFSIGDPNSTSHGLDTPHTPPSAADGFRTRLSDNFSSEEIHRALFPEGAPRSHSLAEFKAGIGEHMKRRYARR